jgi:uncharacterized coiled-coil protein SlyX
MPLLEHIISTTKPHLNDPQNGSAPIVEIDVKAFVGARALVQANSGGGKSRTLRRILEQTHGHVQHIVVDVEGEFYTLREKFDYTIAGHDGDCAATVKNAPRLARILLETGASAILDISELGDKQALFVKAFCEALVNAPRELWHLVMVVIDEAQRFCPQDEEAESTAAVIDLMTRGRKRGFNGVLACQRLSELHKTAAAECNNLLIGRTSLDVDIARARAKLGMSSKVAMEVLPRLKPGEFFCVGPGLTEVVHKVWVGHVETTHPEAGSGAVPMPPPRQVTKAMLAKLSDLDEQVAKEEGELEQLRRRVRELEGGAAVHMSWEHPDSVELKKEIVDLRQQLTAQERENEILTEVVEEMCAVIDSTQERIAEITDKFHHDITDPLLELRNMYADKMDREVNGNGAGARIIEAARKHNVITADELPQVLAAAGRTQIVTNGAMPPMIRAFLTALAQHGTGRHSRSLTKKQILLYTGYAASGPVSKAFAEIERNRWWSKTGSGAYDITDEGLKALGPFEPLPRRDKLRAKIADGLSPMERAFFDAVCARYPQGTSKKEILELTGYAASGPVSKAFAYLVARDWLVSDGPARLVASKELFE